MKECLISTEKISNNAIFESKSTYERTGHDGKPHRYSILFAKREIIQAGQQLRQERLKILDALGNNTWHARTLIGLSKDTDLSVEIIFRHIRQSDYLARVVQNVINTKETLYTLYNKKCYWREIFPWLQHFSQLKVN